jgi:hypothetical protein
LELNSLNASLIRHPRIFKDKTSASPQVMLQWAGKIHAIGQLVYQPGVAYVLTNRATKQEKYFLVVSYKLPAIKILKESLQSGQPQIDLVVQPLMEGGKLLVGTANVTTYIFPDCLGSALCPRQWLVEELEPDEIDWDSTEQAIPLESMPAIAPVRSPQAANENPPPGFQLLIPREDVIRVYNTFLKWAQISMHGKQSAWQCLTTTRRQLDLWHNQFKILSYDTTSRTLQTELPMQQIQNLLEQMTLDVMDCQEEGNEIYEAARQIFLRSKTAPEGGIQAFFLYMLSLKKAGRSKVSLQV